MDKNLLKARATTLPAPGIHIKTGIQHFDFKIIVFSGLNQQIYFGLL